MDFENRYIKWADLRQEHSFHASPISSLGFAVEIAVVARARDNRFFDHRKRSRLLRSLAPGYLVRPRSGSRRGPREEIHFMISPTDIL